MSEATRLERLVVALLSSQSRAGSSQSMGEFITFIMESALQLEDQLKKTESQPYLGPLNPGIEASVFDAQRVSMSREGFEKHLYWALNDALVMTQEVRKKTVQDICYAMEGRLSE